MNERVLGELGLEPDAIAVFNASCEAGDDVRATCIDAGHDGQTTERIIRALVDSGLVAPAGAGSNRLVPIHPGRALASTVTSAQRQINSAETFAADLKVVQDELQAAFDQYEERTTTQRVIEVILGVEAVNERMAELPVRGRHTRTMRPGPPIDSPLKNLERESAQLSGGLSDRAIYDVDWLTAEGGLQCIQRLAHLGQEVRVSHSPLPVRAVVIENEIAVLPVTEHDDGRAGAMIVHSSSIVGVLGALFEEIWRRSSPFGPDSGVFDDTSGEDLTQEDIELLSLLLIGMSDEQAARRLRVSPRTVRRRVSALQERLGVSNRFQLAARAVANGWRPSKGSGQGRVPGDMATMGEQM